MNKNLMIVLIGGFLIAVVVALMVQASLSGSKKEDTGGGPVKKVQIIVAKQNLGIGAELSDVNMAWQEWPASTTFPGAIIRKDGKKTTDMLSGKLRRPVVQGEPIMQSALVTDKDGSFVAASLAEGMRGVAIDVKAAVMVGGLLKPGDRVDVILTYKKKIKYSGEDNPNVEDMIQLNLEKMATETVLQNVRVLAIDQKYKDSEEQVAKSNKSGKTVTLEVDRRGAEILALSKEMGKISLALRKLGDTTVSERNYPVISDERLTNITDEIYGEMLRIQKSTGQNGNIVRIYNGYMFDQVPVIP